MHNKNITQEVARKGGFVAPVDFEDHDWARINAALGRTLTNDERIEIEFGILRYANMRSINDTHITTQATKRELTTFAKLPDDKVIDAFVRLSKTNAHIEIHSSLVEMKLPIKGNAPATYKAAAMLALAQMPDGMKGSSGYRHELAKYIMGLWKHLGHGDMAVWELEGNATPLVQFASALIEVIEKDDPPSYSIVAKLLRKVTA